MDDIREQLEYFAKHLELEKERNNEFKNIKEDIQNLSKEFQSSILAFEAKTASQVGDLKTIIDEKIDEEKVAKVIKSMKEQYLDMLSSLTSEVTKLRSDISDSKEEKLKSIS